MKKSIDKIEQGLFDLIKDTQDGGNEQLIKRAHALKKLQTLVKTVLLATQRRLTNKLNANPQAVLDGAFTKFNNEIKEALK
jgi:hypothetical protein